MLERRRSGQVGQSPIAKLEQLPAVVLLDRIPVPALAVGEDGGVLFVIVPLPTCSATLSKR